MTRQIAKIRNNLDEVTVKITPEEIKCRLINDFEIDDSSFIWEVFDYCPLAALQIVNGKYDIAEKIYSCILKKKQIQESAVKFTWELFSYNSAAALKYIETFEERAKNGCSAAYELEVEMQIKIAQSWIGRHKS
jgi:hypothetical protein